MDEISLYIHIPFCKSKCNYCDFFSKSINCSFNFFQDEYVNALCNEISFYFYNSNCKLKSVYIGGGTPSLISILNLKKIISCVESNLKRKSNDFEFTIELNPDDINYELITFLNESIVNRVSLGVQSLNEQTLKNMNRRATKNKTLEAIKIVNEKFSKRFSIDLIAGYPGDTIENLDNSINEILKTKVDHISLYSLCIEEGTEVYKKINSNEVDYDQDYSDKSWIFAKNKLIKNGFEHYEISNFSKGQENQSVHNLRYWKLQSYVGIGSGASSTIYFDKKNSIRFTNTMNIEDYILFWKKNQESGFSIFDYEKLLFFIQQLNEKKIVNFELIDKNTELFEYLMMNFRLKEGVSKNELLKRFSFDFDKSFIYDGSIIKKWLDKSLLLKKTTLNDVNYFLSDEGRLFLNNFLEELLINL